MKILVTGATGQLGKAIVEQFSPYHQVEGVSSSSMPLDHQETIQQTIESTQPELVIHAAAWTNVDEAARQPEAALAINGQGTAWLAEASGQVGAKFIYISTNEVFDGQQSLPYTETSQPHPMNAYGHSKLAGEQAVMTTLPSTDWLIARVSWLYGPSSVKNFPQKIIQLADERGSLKVVDDEVSTPTYVPDLVQALDQAIGLNLYGIVHLVNEGSCSRFDWAKFVLEQTGRGQVLIEPIKLKDFQRASTPPPHCILANIHAKQAGIVLPDWAESCQTYTATL